MQATRGYGLLENFLAKKRYMIADKLIPENCRIGKILDIGCGNYPKFLFEIKFADKYGIDKIGEMKTSPINDNVHLLLFDVQKEKQLPFPDSFFETITMLAVMEHLEPKSLRPILKEIHRILKVNGYYIMTTPASWTEPLMKIMAKLKLASADEINEHKKTYNHSGIKVLLEDAGFEPDNIRFGYFELFMNLWVRTTK